ncbi:MAG TPA: serine hydrolase [Longimicrobiaceae bacterium]|nr:serine hydrolase [Longimicrobiaceae bacterium]
MKTHRIPGVTALFATAALLAAGGAAQAQTEWPGERWPTAAPREVGLDAAVLDSIDAEIRSGRYGHVDRFLVIRRGRLAFDRRYRHDYDSIYGDSARLATTLRTHDRSGPYNYFNAWWHPFYRRGDLHTLQSVTKTVTSIVIGTAVTRGEFPSLDTPVLAFFDSGTVANVDDRKRRMTVRHLLTMTAGIDWDENRPYGDTANTAIGLEGSYDWTRFTIDRAMSEEPGTRFNYNSGASQLLAHVFRRATGLDVEEYAARHLFGPLGIRDWYWKRTPAGVPDTEGGLYLAADDLARLWYLFLREGAWNGRQVVSRDWVRASVAPAVTAGNRPGAPRYGLKWWLFPNPTDSTRVMWAGSGFGGQFPVAIPEDDLIVVVNQWNILPGRPSLPLGRVLARILGSLTDRGR